MKSYLDAQKRIKQYLETLNQYDIIKVIPYKIQVHVKDTGLRYSKKTGTGGFKTLNFWEILDNSYQLKLDF